MATPEVKVLSEIEISELDVMLAPYSSPKKVIDVTNFCDFRRIRKNKAFVSYHYYPNINQETFVLFFHDTSNPKIIREDSFTLPLENQNDKNRFNKFCGHHFGIKSSLYKLILQNSPFK